MGEHLLSKLTRLGWFRQEPPELDLQCYLTPDKLAILKEKRKLVLTTPEGTFRIEVSDHKPISDLTVDDIEIEEQFDETSTEEVL